VPAFDPCSHLIVARVPLGVGVMLCTRAVICRGSLLWCLLVLAIASHLLRVGISDNKAGHLLSCKAR
jgi:hypothetical protein